MKKIALSNLIFGLVSIIYFIVFTRLSMEMHWMPTDSDVSIIMSGIFAIFAMLVVIISLYVMIYGIVLMLLMKKTMPAVLTVIDSIIKRTSAFVSAIFTIATFLWGFIAGGISGAIFIIALVALAAANKALKKQRA